MRLILASASPRRAELLRSAGFDFEICPADVEESPREGEQADAYTRRVALDKARHAVATTADPAAAVIAADTEVVAAGRILGKPVDDTDAAAMLRTLSAAVHDVLTAVVISANGRELTQVVTTRVWFAALSDEEIEWYVRSGEPRGKAGAYAIQGLGARFIDRIDGSWSNVVGLPIHAVHEMLTPIARQR
jgi:septum formation protein